MNKRKEVNKALGFRSMKPQHAKTATRRKGKKTTKYPKGFDVSLVDIVSFNDISTQQLQQLEEETDKRDSKIVWFKGSHDIFYRKHQIEDFLGVELSVE